MAVGVYSVQAVAQTVSTAITVLELTAPATAVLEIKEAWANSALNTDTMQRIRLLRKTATITGTASPPTPVPLAAYAASGATVKWIATAEGTDGNVVDDDYVHVKNGYLWTPTSAQKRLIVPPSGIVALKFPAAPTSAAWTFGFLYEEIG